MEEIRRQIDAIDRQMAALYEQRIGLIRQVGEYKYEHDVKIYDPDRETQVIAKNLAYLEDPGLAKDYEAFLHFLMDQSKAIQRDQIEKMKNENR
jgi:monofunctional chorismate mutase